MRIKFDYSCRLIGRVMRQSRESIGVNKYNLGKFCGLRCEVIDNIEAGKDVKLSSLLAYMRMIKMHSERDYAHLLGRLLDIMK